MHTTSKSRLNCIASCVAFLLCLVACQPRPAEMKLEQSTFDLGDVRFRDGIHHINAHFANVGDSTLIIKEILTDCPCTTANVNPKTYQKGGKGTIEIQLNLHSFFPDSIVKKVRVYTNSPLREYEEITLKCNLLSN